MCLINQKPTHSAKVVIPKEAIAYIRRANRRWKPAGGVVRIDPDMLEHNGETITVIEGLYGAGTYYGSEVKWNWKKEWLTDIKKI